MMEPYRATDPEFMERLEHFAFGEVVNEPGQELEPVTRHTAILATLLGCQGIDLFQEELPAALDAGVTACHGERDCLSGCGLPGDWPGTSLPESHK